jgi:hypothetical protein
MRSRCIVQAFEGSRAHVARTRLINNEPRDKHPLCLGEDLWAGFDASDALAESPQRRKR